MTVIDPAIVVKYGDGEVHFADPGMRGWAIQVEMNDAKDLQERAEVLRNQIVAVKNLTYHDGTPVTPESLKDNFPSQLFIVLLREWSKYFRELMEGKEVGPLATSGS